MRFPRDGGSPLPRGLQIAERPINAVPRHLGLALGLDKFRGHGWSLPRASQARSPLTCKEVSTACVIDGLARKGAERVDLASASGRRRGGSAFGELLRWKWTPGNLRCARNAWALFALISCEPPQNLSRNSLARPPSLGSLPSAARRAQSVFFALPFRPPATARRRAESQKDVTTGSIRRPKIFANLLRSSNE